MARTDDEGKSIEGDDEMRIRPPEGPSREQISRQLEPVGNYVPPPTPVKPKRQFTVADMLLLTAAVSLGLAGGTWVRPEVFAAAMGVVMLCGLLVVHLYPPEARWARLLWWSLGLAYTVSVLVAVLKPAA